MTDRILLLLGITLMYSTPMVFAAQGSVISEVSGVVNIGIEGMMTVGAFTGATVGYYTGSPWLGFICAGLAGAFFGLIHAFASVTCKSDQTVCGIAMNLVGPGVALFLCRLFFDGATQSLPVTYKIPKLFRGGLSGSLNNLNVDVTTLIALILSICMMILFYRTSWGMHLRAVGEHPGAADTLGINVYRLPGRPGRRVHDPGHCTPIYAHRYLRPGLHRHRGCHLRQMDAPRRLPRLPPFRLCAGAHDRPGRRKLLGPLGDPGHAPLCPDDHHPHPLCRTRPCPQGQRRAL